MGIISKFNGQPYDDTALDLLTSKSFRHVSSLPYALLKVNEMELTIIFNIMTR